MNKKCRKIIEKTGKWCKGPAVLESGFCFRHDPVQKEVALLASQKGGFNRGVSPLQLGEEVSINSPEEVKAFLSKVINAIWTGKASPAVGTTMGFLTRVWLDANDKSELQDRLKKVEEKIGLDKD